MVQKPKCVKTLCMLSAILIAAHAMCSVLITAFPQQSLTWFVGFDPKPYPNDVMLLLLVQDLYLLPIAVLAFLHYTQHSFKGIITAVAAPVLYVLGQVVSRCAGFFATRLSVFSSGYEIVAQISSLNACKQMISLIGTAGFVLLCCAAAITCYAEMQSSQESPQNANLPKNV